MEGIDDSFVTTRQRSGQIHPHVMQQHYYPPNSTKFASVNDFDALPKSTPDIKFDFLIGYHKIHQADMLSNRLVQYANQVAALTHMKEMDMFKNTSTEIIRWLKASAIQPEDSNLTTTAVDKDDPSQTIGLTKIPFEIKQKTNQFIALEEFLLSPSMMGDLIFSTVLAGHTLDGVKRVKDFCGLPDDLPLIYRTLVWSEKWMPDFARVVASLIILTNKTNYVSTPKYQLEDAKQNVIAATRKMRDFSLQNPGRFYSPQPERMPPTKVKTEPIDTEMSFNI